jgi:hypothetical protein
MMSNLSMKIYLLLISAILNFAKSFGQQQHAQIYRSKNYFCSKTDFSFVDTLNLWSYEFDTAYTIKKYDFIKPVGRLTFWRNRPIAEGMNLRLYGKPWTPNITFEIYNSADSAYCVQISKRVQFYSSCTPPDLGGDIFVVDKFIFVNQNVCVDCERYETKMDYCRPVINMLFSAIDDSKITNIQSLIDQLPIKKDKKMKL